MDVDWNGEIVDQVDAHWQERLRPRLDGLTDDEYFWQPVPRCWTVSRRGQSLAPVSFGSGEFTWDYGSVSPEPVTTIAWRLGHLIAGLAESNGKHFGASPVSHETFAYAGSAAEALQQMDDAYGAWIEGVQSLGVEGLSKPQGASAPPAFADAPVARLVMYTSVEIFHHGAEIALLRDLHLRAGGSASRGDGRGRLE